MPSLYGRKAYGDGIYSAGDVVLLDESAKAAVNCTSALTMLFSAVTTSYARTDTINTVSRRVDVSHSLYAAASCVSALGALFSFYSAGYLALTSSGTANASCDLTSTHYVGTNCLNNGGASFGLNATSFSSVYTDAVANPEIIANIGETLTQVVIDSYASASAVCRLTDAVVVSAYSLSDNYAGPFWAELIVDDDTWIQNNDYNVSWSPSTIQNWA